MIFETKLETFCSRSSTRTASIASWKETHDIRIDGTWTSPALNTADGTRPDPETLRGGLYGTALSVSTQDCCCPVYIYS